MANVANDSIVYLLTGNQAEQAAMERLLRPNSPRVVTSFDAADFFQEVDGFSPACLVIDHSPPSVDAHKTIHRLAGEHPLLPVIVMSAGGTIADVSQAMRAGAVDFLAKPVAEATLRERIVEALELHTERLVKATRSQEIQQKIERLSEREQTVMRLVVQGQATKTIARRLDISHKTVEVHRSNITKRMGVESVPQLVRMVTEYDLLRQSEQ